MIPGSGGRGRTDDVVDPHESGGHRPTGAGGGPRRGGDEGLGRTGEGSEVALLRRSSPLRAGGQEDGSGRSIFPETREDGFPETGEDG